MPVQKGRARFMTEQERQWRAQGWGESEITALMGAMDAAYDEGWDQGTVDAGYSPSEVREANGE